jgi:polyisoprenoid-binding protein YceI
LLPAIERAKFGAEIARSPVEILMPTTLTAPHRGSTMGALLLFGAALASTPATSAAAADLPLEPEHTDPTFSVSHLGFADLAGMFLERSGSVSYDEESQELRSATI